MNPAIFALFAAAGATEPASDKVMSSANLAVLAAVIGSIVLFGTATILALGWAFRDGQFDNFEQGAASIFGPDEPIGEPTDAFPNGERPV